MYQIWSNSLEKDQKSSMCKTNVKMTLFCQKGCPNKDFFLNWIKYRNECQNFLNNFLQSDNLLKLKKGHLLAWKQLWMPEVRELNKFAICCTMVKTYSLNIVSAVIFLILLFFRYLGNLDTVGRLLCISLAQLSIVELAVG